MTSRKLFQPWVPKYIRAFVREQGWIDDRRWIVTSGPEMIAKQLCTADMPDGASERSNIARRAWRLFTLSGSIPTRNEKESIEKATLSKSEQEELQLFFAQRAFINCIHLADMALNHWDELQYRVMTENRARKIHRAARDLKTLMRGVEPLFVENDPCSPTVNPAAQELAVTLNNIVERAGELIRAAPTYTDNGQSLVILTQVSEFTFSASPL